MISKISDTDQKELSKRIVRRVVLSGWYGQGNLGDEIILESIVFQLRSRLSNISITVLSESPNRLRKELHLKGVKKTRRRSDCVKRILAVARANAFILGGGGILMDYGNVDTNVSKWLEDMRTAQRLGVPNMAWGVGVGRIWREESKKWMKEVLPAADRVIVRDKESAMSLAEFGIKENVEYTSDPALLLPDLNSFEKRFNELPARKDKPKILVCLRHWYVTGNWTFNDEIFNKMKMSLAKVLSHLAQTRGASITFVPLVTEERKRDDDREVEAEVRSEMDANYGSVIVDHVPDNNEFFRLISDSDLLIGMRLHSLILASAVGVPCIGINYDNKVSSYMASIGASDWTLSMEDSNFENLVRLADDALNGNYPCSIIRDKIEQRRESAKADVESAVSLIESHVSWHSTVKRYLLAATLILQRMLSRKKPRTNSESGTLIVEERTGLERGPVSSPLPLDA